MSDEQPTPRQLALRRISARECSASDVRAYLRRKGVEREEAAEAVAELVAEGYIDDERFSRAMLRSHAARDKGPAYIAAKLAGKGVRRSAGEVKRIFEETSGKSEETMVREILEKRYAKKLASAPERQRAFQALLRRGFSAGVIRAVMRELENQFPRRR